MTVRQYIELAIKLVPAAIGFIAGAVIAMWFQSPDPDQVEMTMALIAAGIGALSGLLGWWALRANNRARAVLMFGGGVGACLVVGLLILAYRWIFR
jgi:tetrahydromethanopterin S-methyltransferase subunit D